MIKTILLAMICSISASFCFSADISLKENSPLYPLKFIKKYHILKIFIDEDEYVLIDFENGIPSESLKDKEFGNHNVVFSAATIKNNKLSFGETKSLAFYDELSEGYESPPKWETTSKQVLNLPSISSNSCKNKYYSKIIKKYFADYPINSFELMDCVKIDFDDNGTDEVIFVAKNYPIPPEIKKIKNPNDYFLLVGLRYLDNKTKKLKTKEIIKSTIYQEIYSDIEYMYTNNIDMYFFRLTKESPPFMLFKEFTSIPKSAGGDFFSCKRFLYFENNNPKVSCFSSFPVDF